MDPALYTFIAHKDLPFANPLSEDTMARAAEMLEIVPGAQIVDFGAGFCELPIRLATAYLAHVSAVELSPIIAAAARERIHSRVVGLPAGKPRGSVTLFEGDAGTFRTRLETASYDVGICIGSTHALGGYEHTLDVLSKIVKPGGSIMVGEGIWQARPSPAYLHATGIGEDEFFTHDRCIELGIDRKLRPRWAVTATQREWDEYEWAHHRAIDLFCTTHRDSPDALAMQARSDAWRKAYYRHGRGTLGFGLYVFEV